MGDLFNLNNKHKDILSFQNILDKYKVKFCLGDEIKFSTIEIKQKYLEWTKKIDKNVINNISKCYHHVYFFKKQDKINEIIKNFTYTEIKKLYEYAICFFMVITEIIEINSVDNIEIIIGEAIYQKEWWINAWTTISNIDFTFSKQLSFEEIFDKLDKRGKNE
ncbi:MAG: hypothetical protein LBS95_02610 [Mycoplasmataceae bacterium]|nr:hypothetical protein [Mycoplasmataceae bacterium]